MAVKGSIIMQYINNNNNNNNLKLPIKCHSEFLRDMYKKTTRKAKEHSVIL